ncbi:MAG: tRNA pseudouridine(13) synthase TruD [Desulfurococcales archaeon]|nr:tRNA pseudouridine(13) synthase TruD [Desulfurococcales archaeon]
MSAIQSLEEGSGEGRRSLWLNLALELLWGIEPRALQPRVDFTVWVERPWGFRVAEPPPETSASGEWLVYLVKRVGDSLRMVSRLKGILGSDRASIQGLKDACAIGYQYVALRSPRSAPSRLEGRGFEAWLIGRRRSPLRLGGHKFNYFYIIVKTRGDPRRLCIEANSVREIPGFYGPQRFGIERPNTHYLGLLRLRGESGGLLREYMMRYPLEEDRAPGYYEEKALGLVRRSRILSRSLEPGPKQLHLDALRAYLFNRTLSRILTENISVTKAAERWVTVRCPGRIERVPAASIPPLRRGEDSWSRIATQIMTEEGVLGLLRGDGSGGLHRQPLLRPLFFPVCRLSCRILGGNTVSLALAAPKGAYATILLRSLALVDWLEYAKCRS